MHITTSYYQLFVVLIGTFTCFFYQQLQATFYENIVKTHRVEPSYFRIGFYGKAFPSFLQVSYHLYGDIYMAYVVELFVIFFFLKNKQFVYRGRAVETIGEFCSRMEKEYPDAEVYIELFYSINRVTI